MKRFRNLTPEQLDTLVERYDHSLPTITTARVSRDGGHCWTSTKVYDESWGKWFVWGREYGPEYVVRADGECSAVGHNEWMNNYPGQWMILLSGELD